MPLSGLRAKFFTALQLRVPLYPSLKPFLINALNVLQYICDNGPFDTKVNRNDSID